MLKLCTCYVSIYVYLLNMLFTLILTLKNDLLKMLHSFWGGVRVAVPSKELRLNSLVILSFRYAFTLSRKDRVSYSCCITSFLLIYKTTKPQLCWTLLTSLG